MTRFRVPEGVLRATLDDEEVLLNPDSGVYHLVNPTGLSLIRRFEDGDSFDEAVDAVAAETGERRARVASDGAAFVEAMVSRGLLETVADDA